MGGGGGGDGDLAALMGFSAFGRQRRPPPKAPTPLAQLLPGTELLSAFVANGGARARVETDAHGVTSLLCGDDSSSSSSERLAVLLSARAASLATGAQDEEQQLLPERSFELLRELQEEKNGCEVRVELTCFWYD